MEEGKLLSHNNSAKIEGERTPVDNPAEMERGEPPVDIKGMWLYYNTRSHKTFNVAMNAARWTYYCDVESSDQSLLDESFGGRSILISNEKYIIINLVTSLTGLRLVIARGSSGIYVMVTKLLPKFTKELDKVEDVNEVNMKAILIAFDVIARCFRDEINELIVNAEALPRSRRSQEHLEWLTTLRYKAHVITKRAEMVVNIASGIGSLDPPLFFIRALSNERAFLTRDLDACIVWLQGTLEDLEMADDKLSRQEQVSIHAREYLASILKVIGLWIPVITFLMAVFTYMFMDSK